MTAAAVYMEGVTKSFAGQERPALERFSAQFPSGIVTGLVGPDGAGKTTILRLLAGLLEPDDGTVSIFGSNDGFGSSLKQDIAYMPQHFGLYEDLSVKENLHLYAQLKAVPKEDRNKKINELMDLTGLTPFLERLAGRLSGGMKQKLGLACALISTPKLLLLDEPSVGVDPISRQELWQMTYRLSKSGIAIVWSSAYLDEAARCEKVILLNEGKTLFDGVPSTLTDRLNNRTFKAEAKRLDRRQILGELANTPGVVDIRLQGRNILLLVEEGFTGSTEGPATEGLIAGLKLKKVSPTFEDAFMDMIAPREAKSISTRKVVNQTSTLNSNGPAIDAQALTKTFGDFTAANQVSFKVEHGEIFGLLGPNGAGKSTTFKMLCGLLRPTSGSARVAGLDLTSVPSSVRARIGYMAQKFSLYGDLSVAQNLDIFARLYGLANKERKSAVDYVVSLLGLQPYLKTKGITLSLGFQRRLALAASIMHRPDILFLDEPTSGVDPLTRREFWAFINHMAEQGVTVVVTTHFLDEAEYCDRIALIDKGRIIASGDPDSLKREAKSNQNPDPSLEDAFVAIVAAQEELVKG